MEKAAEALQFERAAALRDQLAALKQVQAQQIVTAEGDRDIDVFALVGEPGEYAMSVMIIRGGRNLGSTCYFPKGALTEPNEALASFLMQYYAETPAATGNPGQPGTGGGRSADHGPRTIAAAPARDCGGHRARCRPGGWR